MSPGCTSATRTVEPTGGSGPSTNQAGPSPAHTRATASAMTRPDTPRRSITPAIAVFAATSRKVVSQTPPSEAEASVAGRFHSAAPSKAQGPPRLCQDRIASAITHALGNTITAASVRRVVTGADSSRCAAHPHGSQNAPSKAAITISSRPALGSSQYCVVSTYPARPHHARTPPSRAVGAARTTSSSGTTPTQASHHQDGAGKASAGSAPTTNAATRPAARRRRGPGSDRRHPHGGIGPPVTVPIPRAGHSGVHSWVQTILLVVPLATERIYRRTGSRVDKALPDPYEDPAAGGSRLRPAAGR